MARRPFSDDEIREIVRRLVDGESAAALARAYNTTRASIALMGADIGGARISMQDEVQRNAEAIDLAVWALAATANEPEWPTDQSKHLAPVRRMVYATEHVGPQHIPAGEHWIEREVVDMTPEYMAFVQRVYAERERRQKFVHPIAARYIDTGELVVEGVRVDPAAYVKADTSDF